MKRFLIFISALAVLAGFFFWIFIQTTLPDFESLKERRVIESTKIFDRSGEVLLYDVHGEVKRTVIPFEDIPRHMKNATVAMEDKSFYSHPGISFGSILRAFFVNFLSGEVRQGGSTITQQLAKNTFLTPERTIIRKIKELVLALKIESRFTKDEILNLYLNEISYGANSYGVEAASQTYFGKSAKELSLAQAAYLAALPKAPTRYSPYGSRPEELEARKKLVLERMLGLGFITQDEFRRAKEEKVRFEPRGLGSIKAPHFSLYIKEYLVEKYGEDVVEKGGLKVKTTLNWQFQQKAEEILKKFAEENEKKFNAFNAGLVMMDPKLGEILAMVGSRDYFEEPRPQGCAPGINCRFDPKVNITLRSRQPGSAFKPFVYATLFKKGFTPEAVLFDLPTEFNPLCSSEGKAPEGLDEDKCYHPQNYDEKFRGPVSLREALAQSINLPSVKVLYLAGLLDSLKLARDMGITTLNEPERYGLTLVLGGGEVKLLELTGAYSVFATGGILNQPTGILKVEDGSGKILQEYRPKNFQVLDSNIANIISDILTDNKARAPAFGESSFLYFPERPVAVKTGTTNDYRDAWVVGYAPNLALGVWVGNNDNTPMEKKVAGFIAAPLWNAVLKEIFKELPREEFNLPLTQNVSKPILKGEWRGGMVYKIDKISKKLATEFTPEELIEERVIREVHSILYWLDKNNPEGPRPENPQNDGQFNNWEMVVRRWAGAQNLLDEDEGVIPKEFDDLHRPEYTPKATFIINPEGESFRPHTNLRVLFLVESKFPLEQADLFLGSEYIGSSKIYPFEFSITLPDLEMEEITISANIYDIVRNKTNLSKTIRISDL